MDKNRVHTKKELAQLRKELRENLTSAEAFLWDHLKSRRLDGHRFTKQHSIGGYIVDFYCASKKLVIELDGEVHNHPEAMEYDQKRIDYLNGLGYKVIRFENKMVFDFLDSVLQGIKDNFKSEQ